MVDPERFQLCERKISIEGDEDVCAVRDVLVEIGENMRVPNLVDLGCGA